MSSVSMRVVALAIGLTLFSAPSAGAEDPSASIGHPFTGRWQGTAAETPSIYLGPVSATVTLDLKLTYLRPLSVRSGTVSAEGKVVKFGRQTSYAEGFVRDGAGNLAVHATATFTMIGGEKAK